MSLAVREIDVDVEAGIGVPLFRNSVILTGNLESTRILGIGTPCVLRLPTNAYRRVGGVLLSLDDVIPAGPIGGGPSSLRGRIFPQELCSLCFE